MMTGRRATRPETFSEQQQQSPTQMQAPHQHQAGVFAEDSQEPSRTSQTVDQAPLSQMSEQDKFGLAGLLRMIHSESPDVASLAIGQDLMSLGLDLNQPE